MYISKSNRILMIMMLIGISVFSAACTGDEVTGGEIDGNTNSSEEAGENGNSKTTITFWHETTQQSEEALEKIVEAFEAENTDISVDLVYVGGGDIGQNERLLAATAAGNPPDVTWFNRFEINSWANQGSLVSLTEYAERDGITKDMFYPFTWDEATFEGDLYGVPADTDSRVMLYNKDHFEEAGLDPENPPMTIDELEEAAELLTIKDGNRFERIGLIPWHNQGWLYTWAWAFGGDFMDEETGEITANHPQNVKALQWMADFGAKYNIDHISSFSDGMGTNEMDPFITEQLSMQVAVPSVVSQIERYNPDLNYGAFPVPTPTGDNHNSWSGGWSLVVPEGSENVDEAWELLAHFVSEESQLTLAEIANTFSVIESVNEEAGFAEHEILSVFMDVLPVSNSQPVTPEGPLLWNELADAMEDGYRGNVDPQEALDNVTKVVNEALGN